MPRLGYISCSSNQRLYYQKYNRAEHTHSAVGHTGSSVRYLPHELPWMTRGWLSRKLMLRKHKILVDDDCFLRHRQGLNFEDKFQIVLLDRRRVSASLCTGPELLNTRGCNRRHHRKPAPARRPRSATIRAIEI